MENINEIIWSAVPKSKSSNITKEEVFTTAQSLVNYFVERIRSFERTRDDIELAQCMNYGTYENIAKSILAPRFNRYTSSNNVPIFQSLFIMACLLSVPHAHQSTYEEEFINKVGAYLEMRSYYFNGSELVIKSIVRQINPSKFSSNLYKTKEKSSESEITEKDLEDTFSLRYRRTDDYRRLLQFLETERKAASDGDWGRYALSLYRANIFANKPNTFKAWFPRFCELFGREVAYQVPNKLDRTACRKDIKVYLPNW